MRLGLHQLGQSGATDGQVATWDAAAGLWVPLDAATGGGLPVGGTAGQVLTKQSSADYDADWATPSGGGGGWDNPVSLPLSTLTGWTAGAGTWAISSGVIRQSSTAASEKRLRYTAAKIPSSAYVAEVDINVATATSTSTSRAGFLLNYPSGSDSANSILCCLKSTVSGFITQVYWEYEGVSAGPGIALPGNVALGTWMTLRVHKSGSDVTAWVNGTLIGTAHINQSTNIDASTLALYSYTTDVSYRNLDIWTPTMP